MCFMFGRNNLRLYEACMAGLREKCTGGHMPTLLDDATGISNQTKVIDK